MNEPSGNVSFLDRLFKLFLKENYVLLEMPLQLIIFEWATRLKPSDGLYIMRIKMFLVVLERERTIRRGSHWAGWILKPSITTSSHWYDLSGNGLRSS
jgi:hypothetical protein